jgi:hypothetical protein
MGRMASTGLTMLEDELAHAQSSVTVALERRPFRFALSSANRRSFLRSRWLAARICGQLIWIKGGDEMACTKDSLFPKEQVPASRPPPSTPVRSGPSLLLRSASRARVRRWQPMTLGKMRANGVRSRHFRPPTASTGQLSGLAPSWRSSGRRLRGRERSQGDRRRIDGPRIAPGG